MARLMFSITVFIIPSHFAQRLEVRMSSGNFTCSPLKTTAATTVLISLAFVMFLSLLVAYCISFCEYGFFSVWSLGWRLSWRLLSNFRYRGA